MKGLLGLFLCLLALFVKKGISRRDQWEDAHQLTSALETTFDVNFANDINGGCRSHEMAIRRAWQEVKDLIASARKSIVAIEPGAPQTSDPTERAHRLKTDQAFRALFGSGHYNHNLEWIHRQLQEIFERNQQRPNGVRRYPLRCNDNWLQWKDPTDSDPRATGTHQYTLANPAPGFEAYPKGAWYGPSLPADKALIYFDGIQQTGNHPLCSSPPRLAWSSPDYGTIFFCDALLSQQITAIATHPPRGSQLAGPLISAMAITWLHEMTVYLLDWRDLLLDAQGRSQDDPDQRDGVKETDRRDQATGFSYANSVAVHYSNFATVNPENFALFAAATFWDEYYWGTGVAKTTPEPAGTVGIRQVLPGPPPPSPLRALKRVCKDAKNKATDKCKSIASKIGGSSSSGRRSFSRVVR